jgi:hypothetical protein
MKKYLIALLFIASQANAGQVSVPLGMPIIGPELATSFQVFSWSANTPQGETVVCPTYEMYSRGGKCLDELGRNRWTRIRDVVPVGKTYTGFSINPHSGAIYVYWK